MFVFSRGEWRDSGLRVHVFYPVDDLYLEGNRSDMLNIVKKIARFL